MVNGGPVYGVGVVGWLIVEGGMGNVDVAVDGVDESGGFVVEVGADVAGAGVPEEGVAEEGGSRAPERGQGRFAMEASRLLSMKATY